MSKGPFILWVMLELGQLYLTASSEIAVMAYLGQPATLPCVYSSWSQSSNSMCWGKGPCPNSKCNEELIHTSGTVVMSRNSFKYKLRGNILGGDVSLTILNTNEGDGGVYCCRIEVPGWFNDVKKNIRLQLRSAPTTPDPTTTWHLTTTLRPTTTLHPTTSPYETTVAALPTTTTTVPDLITTTLPETRTSTALTTMMTTCPLTVPSSIPEAASSLLTTEPSTEDPILTAESETFLLSSDSQRTTAATSVDTALLTSKESKASVLPSTSQSPMQETSDSVTILQTTAFETTIHKESKERTEQPTALHVSHQRNNFILLLIIAPTVGCVLLVLLTAFLLRGAIAKTYCSQKHTRLDIIDENKNVLNDMQHEREDEDGLFVL
ncbi:T-cell immunoglobulin and mucin domain-containing protein 4 isoform X2 [Tupaia chinensis]|uniref:T-cell immunoglobulin and mucin domain-containing protein 4 isoform X2 n=1 Tax=Tupaia chinensis TaxID=246437 RepID=UPI000FFC93C4|nr:T-cell immunoglobulin and mucin domain-containing protein 4 isoform X2 [Tupaia chinensis]